MRARVRVRMYAHAHRRVARGFQRGAPCAGAGTDEIDFDVEGLLKSSYNNAAALLEDTRQPTGPNAASSLAGARKFFVELDDETITSVSTALTAAPIAPIAMDSTPVETPSNANGAKGVNPKKLPGVDKVFEMADKVKANATTVAKNIEKNFQGKGNKPEDLV